MFIRRLRLILPEDKEFTEKTAAEYERKCVERLEEQAKIKAVSPPQKSSKTEGAAQRFNAVRSSFDALTFRQKLALKIAYTQHGTLKCDDLVAILDGMGFRESKEAVEHIINRTNLVEWDHTTRWLVTINPAVIEDIGEILETTQLT